MCNKASHTVIHNDKVDHAASRMVGDTLQVYATMPAALWDAVECTTSTAAHRLYERRGS